MSRFLAMTAYYYVSVFAAISQEIHLRFQRQEGVLIDEAGKICRGFPEQSVREISHVDSDAALNVVDEHINDRLIVARGAELDVMVLEYLNGLGQRIVDLLEDRDPGRLLLVIDLTDH